MSTPILATKLFIPPSRPNLVYRPRLIERLNEGLHGKLILISAPAGFGKTTLVSSWIDNLQVNASGVDQIASHVAWLSLDERDNDLTRFLSYLIAALQTVAADIGKVMLNQLQSQHSPPVESLLTALLNDAATTAGNVILVLDDYHLIDAKPIDNALAFLLDYLPPQMHLVITTREDPPFPLARYRARGQMTEIRDGDLRFTPAEAARFLNQMMGLNLSAEAISTLETRTEGWIAGLQMAALSIQGRAENKHSDIGAFIETFTGDHHFILDYLVEEVLQQQPKQIRNFLLQTSVLERLSEPLCDAVIGVKQKPESSREPDASKKILETLKRGNLFVIPLDDTRQWYRYHHLFAEVLQTHLGEKHPEQLPILHQRASLWYEQNDLMADAIHHALAAKDFARTVELIEPIWQEMNRSHQGAMVLGWLNALPDELIRARAVLSVAYAWSLLNSGDLEAAESRLRDAEYCLGASAIVGEPSENVSSKAITTAPNSAYKESLQSLPGIIASAHAYLAQAQGDVQGSMAHARQALDLLPKDDYRERAIPAALLGLACWSSGDLEDAHRAFTDVMIGFQMVGKERDAIDIGHVVADIKFAQGYLQEARKIYQQLLRLATNLGDAQSQGTTNLYLGLVELCCQQDNLEAAREYLLQSKEMGRQFALPDGQYRLCIAEAYLREAEGDLDGTLDLLLQAEKVYYRSPLPDVRPVAALKARIWVRQGRLTEALSWAREQNLSVNDELSYLREFEYMTWARILIAHFRHNQSDSSIHQAAKLLNRLLQAAEAGERLGSVIEARMLQSLIHEAQGNYPAALMALEPALTLAETEGYVQLFVNEGAPMVALLREVSKQDTTSHYVHQLLAAFGQSSASGMPHGENPITQPLTQQQTVPVEPLIDPLSERELDVLRLLQTELSGPEIARELSVSLNTIRTHTKNIYSKLGVNSRRAAVRRAEGLGLL
ncbi:MAG: LuxR C-terminal-related transcriptional regulator [Chloroflexota bacterium]